MKLSFGADNPLSGPSPIFTDWSEGWSRFMFEPLWLAFRSLLDAAICLERFLLELILWTSFCCERDPWFLKTWGCFEFLPTFGCWKFWLVPGGWSGLRIVLLTMCYWGPEPSASWLMMLWRELLAPRGPVGFVVFGRMPWRCCSWIFWIKISEFGPIGAGARFGAGGYWLSAPSLWLQLLFTWYGLFNELSICCYRSTLLEPVLRAGSGVSLGRL